MSDLFRGVNARTKVWLRFMLANLKKKSYRVPFLELKANKKCTPDVFTSSTDLRKVSLIHLEVNMLGEWQKQQT